MTTNDPGIVGRAMLANIYLGAWQARKHDRDITEKANSKWAKDPDAGRYHKHLFGGHVESLSHVRAAENFLRATHYAQTLPWSDAGWRLLPTANYLVYTAKMREAIARFNDAVEAFIKEYPTLCQKAKARLGSMYDADDYPAVGAIKGKFHASLEFSPLPTGDDFRVDLPKKELARIAKEVEGRMVDAAKDAMTEAWKRLGDAVGELRDRLVDGKHLRETMVARVQNVAETLGRLNLTGDADLERLCKQTLRDLATIDATGTRKDTKAQQDAAAKAEEILKAMKGLYTPAKEAK